MDKTIDKIKKCFSLSSNNPNEYEAQAAMLKAHELMAKHGLKLVDIDTEDEQEDIIKVNVEVANGAKWKYTLAAIIGDNFRCKILSVGSNNIIFYGYEVDAEAAGETFKYLFKVGSKLAIKARLKYKNVYGHGTGIYNSFVLGFVQGIKYKLGEQSTALLVIMSKEVDEQFKEYLGKNSKTKSVNFSSNINSRVYNDGIEEGKQAIGTRRLGV